MIISAPKLLNAIRLAKASTQKWNVVPILAYARLTAEDGVATIRSTDLELELIQTVPASGAPFDAMLPLPELTRLLRYETGDAVLHRDGEQLRIEVGDVSFEWRDLAPPEDYPLFEKPEEFKSAEFDQTALLDMIRFAETSISTEETRYYLNGIYFDTEEETTKAIATDGHRLTRFEFPETNLEKGGIIHRDACRLIKRILTKGSKQPATLHFGSTRGWIKVGRTELVFKLIDGTYPNWRQVIPNHENVTPENEFSVSLSRHALRQAPSPAILALHPKLGTMTATPVGGIGVVTLPLKGKGADRGFQLRYVLELLKASRGPIQIKGGLPSDPVTIYPDDPRAQFVLMPQRI